MKTQKTTNKRFIALLKRFKISEEVNVPYREFFSGINWLVIYTHFKPAFIS